MPQVSLHVLKGEPLSEQEAGGRVSKVVDTDMRQLVPAQEFPELPVALRGSIGVPRGVVKTRFITLAGISAERA